MLNYYDLLDEIKSGSVKNLILDTDTYNEVDDQFALSYALFSDKVRLLSVNAAPFFNDRSTSPEDGMEKSYSEILNIMQLCGREVPVYKGSRRFLTDMKTPEETDAARNIIETAEKTDGRLYVVAIGAITNVASALIMKPELKDRIAVVWLGGNAFHWPSAREFNMVQDIPASKVIFDSGVPLILLPAMGVVSELHTTISELDHYLAGKNKLCDYLTGIVRGYSRGAYAWSKVVWDIAGIAALALPSSMDFTVVPAPIITSDCTYSFDNARHPMIYVRWLHRDAIFGEVFKLLGEKA